MTSSTEKPGVSKTSEQGVDYAVSLKSRPSEEKKRGDNIDKVTLRAFLNIKFLITLL